MAKPIADIKNIGGRPRTGIGEPVLVRLSPDLMIALDSWRSSLPENPGRPEAIRRMIGICTNKELVKVVREIARAPKAEPKPKFQTRLKGEWKAP